MNTSHPTTTKTWYWIGGIIAVSFATYYMFFLGPTVPSDSSLLETGSGEEMIGTQVMNLLDQIQSLKIDPTMFQSPVYKSLQDYSVAIPTENVGRDNPFSPFPGYSGLQTTVTPPR